MGRQIKGCAYGFDAAMLVPCKNLIYNVCFSHDNLHDCIVISYSIQLISFSSPLGSILFILSTVSIRVINYYLLGTEANIQHDQYADVLTSENCQSYKCVYFVTANVFSTKSLHTQTQIEYFSCIYFISQTFVGVYMWRLPCHALLVVMGENYTTSRGAVKWFTRGKILS